MEVKITEAPRTCKLCGKEYPAEYFLTRAGSKVSWNRVCRCCRNIKATALKSSVLCEEIIYTLSPNEGVPIARLVKELGVNRILFERKRMELRILRTRLYDTDEPAIRREDANRLREVDWNDADLVNSRFDQICWSCSKAANINLCSWAGGEPRCDWIATERVYSSNSMNGAVSYRIESCPAYEYRGRGVDYSDKNIKAKKKTSRRE